jgi:GNAT superfamily N-acetyltransferase
MCLRWCGAAGNTTSRRPDDHPISPRKLEAPVALERRLDGASARPERLVQDGGVAVALRSLTDLEVYTFLSHLKSTAVDDLTNAGYDAAEAALLVDLQITAAFPHGDEPSEHRVCGVIRDDELIGHVWFGPAPGAADGSWWLYELSIVELHRGGGVGAQVIALVEAEVRRSDGRSIGLRVFDDNHTARSLYERAGYRPVSTLMRKVL